MEADYLIAGGGLCGVLLGRALLQQGQRIMVVDDGNVQAASRVAGGIINPVTGMRLVRSWMIEELMPVAMQTYREAERELGVPLLKECDILDFYATMGEQAVFEERASEGNEYLRPGAEGEEWQGHFRFNYGMGVIAPCLLLDLGALIRGTMDQWRKAGCLLPERMDTAHCEITDDYVQYKDIRARKLIFCDGADGANSPFFRMLPWSKDKGEAIIAAIPGLPRDHIYRQGISIVPWGRDLFWIGASHDWKYDDVLPSATFRNRVKEILDYWLKIPYTLVDHLVALRPANLDRKPFVGLHPVYGSVGIFNGMGGKGVSMAPYFARQFARHLIDGSPLQGDVDVRRYSRILTRK